MRFQYTKIALASALLLAIPAVSFAHGGVYRGPGDTVPPGGGGDGSGGRGSGGPRTGDPGLPSDPGMPSPPTGGQPTPPTGGSRGGGRVGGTSGPRGVQIGEDLDSWLYWWEFNKAPYLQLKRRIWSGAATTGEADIHVGRGERRANDHTLRPSATDLRTKVQPALKHALKDPSSNRDIVSSALIALARIGQDPSIVPLLKRFLDSKDQEKQESAALALGISALPAALDDLLALAADSRRGRELVGKPSGVGFRTRSFACYGCGLIAFETKSAGLKRRVFDAMKRLLDPRRDSRRDVRVAALHAIRLLRPTSDGEAGVRLRDDAVAFLLEYVDRPNREVFAQVRAHAYSAIARLVGRSERHDAVRERILLALNNKKERPWIHQSAILALGEMALPKHDRASAAIRRYMLEGKDQQAKRFCAVALGQIGGEANVVFLRKRLLRAQSTIQPWLAIGLGLSSDRLGFEASSVVDVRAAYRSSKAPLPTSGLAIALGIFADKSSEDVILQRLLDFKNNDEAAGYHAIALGLIGHSYAIADINQLLDKAGRRETLLTQCAIALGLLGDKNVGLKLVSRLASDNSVAVSSALAQALGFIGDRRSIDSLVAMLTDKQQKDIPRAFAAVALGLIGDKEELPWSSKIAVNINYRANVETLTGNSTGVLDIL